MLYDAVLSQQFADQLLAEGIWRSAAVSLLSRKEGGGIRVSVTPDTGTHHLDQAIAALPKWDVHWA